MDGYNYAITPAKTSPLSSEEVLQSYGNVMEMLWKPYGDGIEML